MTGSPPRRPPARRPADVIEMALIAVGLVVLGVLMPHALAGDDNTRYADIDQLLRHGHLTQSQYSLVLPLLSTPFLLLGYAFGSPEAWAAHFNVFIVAVGLLVAWLLLRGRVDAGLFRKFALVLLFASLLTNRLRDWGVEVSTATLVIVGALAVVLGRRPLLGWAAIVLGVVNTPAAALGLVLFTGGRAVQTKRLRPLLSVGAALVLIGAEAWIRRGSPFTTGYEGNHGYRTILPYSGKPGFSYPLLLGLLSILFSFGRGLAFYTPGLLLWLGARTRRITPCRSLVVLLLLFSSGLVLFYAKWWAWYGGLSWGPRFFAFVAVPASLFVAARLQDEGDTALGYALTLGVLTLSGWVGVTGALQDFSQGGFCAQNGFQLESLCWYTPDYSSLWWPVLHPPALTLSKVLVAAYCALVFAYLAGPLIARIGHAVAPYAQRRSWAAGWRF